MSKKKEYDDVTLEIFREETLLRATKSEISILENRQKVYLGFPWLAPNL